MIECAGRRYADFLAAMALYERRHVHDVEAWDRLRDDFVHAYVDRVLSENEHDDLQAEWERRRPYERIR